MIEVLLNNELGFDVSEQDVVQVITHILVDHEIQTAEVSLAIVDDATIHQLNREHLDHDYPTDVLSFVLERSANSLDGEIIVSSDTATRLAPEFDWSSQSELTLYLIHGALHLVGYDDHSDEDRLEMRRMELQYLEKAGIAPTAQHLERCGLEQKEPHA